MQPLLWFALCVAAFGQTASPRPDPFDSAREAYLDAYTVFKADWVQFLREQTRLHIKSDLTLTADAVVNPWLPFDQESAYFPSFNQIVRPNPLNDDAQDIFLSPLPPQGIGHWIPPTFRLAELLGLGRNTVRWEGEFISPQLTEMGTIPVVYALESRLRFHLIGKFTIDEGKTRIAQKTFHRHIDSKSYRQAGVINVRHSNPNRFMVANFSIRKAYASDAPLWTHENIHERLLDDAVTVSPSERELQSSAASKTKVVERITQRLAELRSHYSAAAKALGPTSFLRRTELDDARQAIEDQLIAAGHQPALCVLEDYNTLPSNAALLHSLAPSSSVVSVFPLPSLSAVEAQLNRTLHHLYRHRLNRP